MKRKGELAEITVGLEYAIASQGGIVVICRHGSRFLDLLLKLKDQHDYTNAYPHF